jgi:hypothetical protein
MPNRHDTVAEKIMLQRLGEDGFRGEGLKRLEAVQNFAPLRALN